MTREERNERARIRMAEYRKTEGYRLWLTSSRELRRSLKEKYRRELGAITRDEIAARAAERAAAVDARRVARADFLASFIGPPSTNKAMTDAEYYLWRARTDPAFYVRELDRAQRHKARTRPGYRDSIVRWQDMPLVVAEVKHLQYLIARQLKRRSDEDNQRTA